VANSSSSGAKVESESDYPSAFPICLHGLGRVKFTFTFMEVYSDILFVNWSEYC
jgi:hypothetical protein